MNTQSNTDLKETKATILRAAHEFQLLYNALKQRLDISKLIKLIESDQTTLTSIGELIKEQGIKTDAEFAFLSALAAVEGYYTDILKYPAD